MIHYVLESHRDQSMWVKSVQSVISPLTHQVGRDGGSDKGIGPVDNSTCQKQQPHVDAIRGVRALVVEVKLGAGIWVRLKGEGTRVRWKGASTRVRWKGASIRVRWKGASTSVIQPCWHWLTIGTARKRKMTLIKAGFLSRSAK